jgi:release factor glutamine methyltransferase
LRVSNLRREIEKELSSVSLSPSGEATFILREFGLDNPIEQVREETVRGVRKIVDRRVRERIPLQYLFSRAYFLDLALHVEEGVFIPRPETERLVEVARDVFTSRSPERILDVGTGTGAIALSLCRVFPEAGVVATDVSRKALEITRRNTVLNSIENEPFLVLGDGLNPFGQRTRFDLIVSNPPYVKLTERFNLPPEVLSEPGDALFSGEDGLDLSRELIREGSELLRPGGHLLLEIHPVNLGPLIDMAHENDYATGVERDLSGRDRVLVLRKD